MSVPMEQNGGGDGTEGDALSNSIRNRKGDKISLECKEEAGMSSEEIQANKFPISNERWFYEGLIKYYTHKRMMRKAANYIEQPRTRIGMKRRELDKRYHEQINEEIGQVTENVDELRNKLKKGKKTITEYVNSDKAEKMNWKEEERQVANTKQGEEEFTVKLE